MNPLKSVVLVIGEDPSVRKSVKCLLTSPGYDAEMFESAEEFLNARPNPALLPKSWCRSLARLIRIVQEGGHFCRKKASDQRLIVGSPLHRLTGPDARRVFAVNAHQPQS